MCLVTEQEERNTFQWPRPPIIENTTNHTSSNTKTWTDAGAVTSGSGYVLGGTNAVTFTSNFFAWAAVRVKVGSSSLDGN